MSLSPRRSFLLSSVFLASLLGLAGAAEADEPVTVITLKDHAFAPAEVEIPAGVKVKLGSYEFFDDFHPQTRGHLIVK
jgi:hypothetical protein